MRRAVDKELHQPLQATDLASLDRPGLHGKEARGLLPGGLSYSELRIDSLTLAQAGRKIGAGWRQVVLRLERGRS